MMRQRQTKRRGYSILAVMVFVFTVALMGAATLSLTMTHDSNAKRTAEKVQAGSLAETGVNVLFDKIRYQMIQSQSYPFSVAATALNYTDSGGNVVPIGTYEAKVVSAADVQTDFDYGSNKYRRHTYKFIIEGKGVATNGVQSVLRTRFEATMDYGLAKQSLGTNPNKVPNAFSFPVGAIVSNNKVNMVTNNGIRTYAPDGLGGHVIANGGMTWDTPAGNKSSNFNPNVLDIQGQYLVPSGTTYDQTVGSTGLGNSNGSVNYRNPAAPASGSFSGSPANTVLQMPHPVTFADSATVSDWQTTWLSQAGQTGSTSYASGLSSSDITPRADGKLTIQAPAVINGDLLINGGADVSLIPYSTNPAQNVIYVKGNVKNLGQLRNLGVKLVFEGKYSDSTSSLYTVDANGSPFNGYYQTMERAAMLSLSSAADAFTFSTNSSSATGMIYATRGGIKIAGANAEFTGMLLAGGSGDLGNIDIKPSGGNSFVVHFEPYCATGGILDLDAGSTIDVTWIPVGVVNNFAPSKMSGYVMTK